MRSNNDKPSVKATVIRIHNVMGVEDAEIKLGNVTMISGRNGSGKTSRIEAFKAVLKGGHDATLLRQGEEVGEIVLVLSDDVEIRKQVRAGDSKTQVTHPEYGKLSKPAAFLDGLRDAFGVNPIDFLTAKPKDRVELLLSAIPMVVDPVDLVGIQDLCSERPDLSRHALEVLAGIDKDLSAQRRDISRSAKEKRASALEMTKALPAESVDANGVNVLASVDLEYSDFRNACEMAKGAIVSKANVLVNSIKDESHKAVDDLNRKRDEEIEAIRSKYDRQADEVRFSHSDRCDAIDSQANKELEELAEHRATQTQKFESAIATARANADAFTRSQSAREHIAAMEASADVLESDAQALTDALAELAIVRGNLLEKLPIKSVALVDGDIFVDGIPFDRVNESRRIRLSFEVAMLRSGNLPFSVVDGAERLDSASLKALGQVATEMGIQLVLSKVTDGELEVSRIA